MREAASPEASGCILGGSWRSTVRISSCPTNRGVFFEPARGSDEGCQPAFRVGPTVGPLSVSDRSKCYLVLLKVPRKLLTLRSLQTCQGSGVGSIPIGRSIAHPSLRMSHPSFPQPREFSVKIPVEYRYNRHVDIVPNEKDHPCGGQQARPEAQRGEGGLDVVHESASPDEIVRDSASRRNGRRRVFLESWAYVSDGARGHFGRSGGIELPEALAHEVLENGVELSVAIDRFAGAAGIRDAQGAWGVLSSNFITRQEAFRVAVIAAFAPFYNGSMYRAAAGSAGSGSGR